MNSYRIPSFHKKYTKSTNYNIYNSIQTNEEVRFRELIQKVAAKGIFFHCFVLQDFVKHCFNVTKDLYMKNGGKKFIIWNQFDFSNYNLFEFAAIQAVSSCFTQTRKQLSIIKSEDSVQKQEIKRNEPNNNNNCEKNIKISISRPLNYKSKNFKLSIDKPNQQNNKEKSLIDLIISKKDINKNDDSNDANAINKGNETPKTVNQVNEESSSDENEKLENKDIEIGNDNDDDEEYDINDEKDGIED